ncbi:MAG TPA: thioredoxin domain-containing protein [Thermoplasmata archaeon]|nr:thioredoxin domain-containing protein [Thermoplasmata archaeon]
MDSRESPLGDELLPELVLPVEGRDHCLGSPGAKYSLVEYGDFASPHCAHLHPIVQELVRELGDELCFVFRDFPLPNEYPNAVRAAEAAEAAAQQGKFWLMHDRLFAHQSELSDAFIRQLARDLPLEMTTYDRDLASGAPARRIGEDKESGEEAGVEETPTLFVNGRMHVGSYEFLPLLNALQTAPAPGK